MAHHGGKLVSPHMVLHMSNVVQNIDGVIFRFCLTNPGPQEIDFRDDLATNEAGQLKSS